MFVRFGRLGTRAFRTYAIHNNGIRRNTILFGTTTIAFFTMKTIFCEEKQKEDNADEQEPQEDNNAKDGTSDDNEEPQEGNTSQETQDKQNTDEDDDKREKEGTDDDGSGDTNEDADDGPKEGENETLKSAAKEESCAHLEAQSLYPRETAEIVFPPDVPAPITRTHPVRLVVEMNTSVEEKKIDGDKTYQFWTFNGGTPGPFIRARKGDILEVHFKNNDPSGMQHNLDFHAVTGPGGGSPLLTADTDETKKASFNLLYPGLFYYHCAVGPIAEHIANGMYGAILVEPEEGFPPVDKEFSVIQSEFYTAPDDDDANKLVMNFNNVTHSKPSYVLFNGRNGALTENPLEVKGDSRIRIYFVNAGPNLVSSFHVIGTIFDKLYRDADLISPPARGVQCTLVPAGGATVVEMNMTVPGTYTIVDHSIYRVEQDINVTGPDRPDIYYSEEAPKTCPDCKVHPK